MKVEMIDCEAIGLEVLDVGAEAAGEEGSYEGLSGLRNDVIVQIFPSGVSFVIIHGERLVDRFRGVACVPRVDGNTGAEPAVAVRASELDKTLCQLMYLNVV